LPANRVGTDEELLAAVEGWRRPYQAGPLTEDEMEQFWTDGYVLKEGILGDSVLDPCIESINALVEELAQDLLRKGRINEDQLHEDKGFLDRLTALDKEFPNASVWVSAGVHVPNAQLVLTLSLNYLKLHKQPFKMPADFRE
jgi:hypothetical protein